MAEVSFVQPASAMVTIGRDHPVSLDHYSTMPEPNPPFVFPMQTSSAPIDSSEPEHHANGEAAGSRRFVTRGRPHHISISTLPAFDFHPSNSSSTVSPPTSPSQSPTKNMAVSARAIGHRRGGSEFIGGDGKTGGPGLMSTSPTKDEAVFPTPQATQLGPPNNRRGHAHRRSGAISSNDLSTILRPKDLAPPRSGSAPTTPSDPSLDQRFLPFFDRSASQPIVSTVVPTSESPPQRCIENALGSSRPRPRVGFSDTLEFIPRPLSTISSDTSSSLSTVRAGHSATGSITSIVSGGTSSPPSARSQVLDEKSKTYEPVESRSRNASEIPLSYHSGHYTGLYQGLVIKDEKHLSPAAASRQGLGHAGNHSSGLDFQNPLFNDDFIRSETDNTTVGISVELSSQAMTPVKNRPPCYLAASKSRTSPEQKVTKRQRKVKSWAGSILSRRGRYRSLHGKTLNRRVIAPCPRNLTSTEEFSLDNLSLDEDSTCTTHNLQDDSAQPTRIDFSTWRPLSSSPIPDSAVSSTMLDLDAALGPFNTPVKGPSDADITSGFSLAKRRMHSSGAIGGFAGPGMHYHRRAESAPEMAPINSHIFSLHRLGSSSTMADVFEEDEESESQLQHPDSGTTELPNEILHDSSYNPGVEITDADNGAGCSPDGQDREMKQAESTNVNKQHVELEPPVKNYASIPIPEPDYKELFPVEVVDASEEPRFSMMTKSSDDSTITPRLSLDALSRRPASAPLDFARPFLGQYVETPDLTSSALSSPSFTNTSFDVPRLSTARSSITDRTTWSSSRPGEHLHGHGYSADDVPSLTSSASTMISANPPHFSSNTGTRSSIDHSSSFTAAVTARPRPTSTGKRSSLASLSRLVGSSYSEKSKLSIESHASHDDADKSNKRKGNRIGRMMRFWKSKEKLKT